MLQSLGFDRQNIRGIFFGSRVKKDRYKTEIGVHQESYVELMELYEVWKTCAQIALSTFFISNAANSATNVEMTISDSNIFTSLINI